MVCNPLTPDAFKFIIRSPLASVGAFRWIRPNSPTEGDIGTVDFVKAPRTLAQNVNGAVIHNGTLALAQNPPLGKWHHISIHVNGELMPDADAVPPEPPDVQSRGRGNLSSLLKARLTLSMGTAREREIEFDIGAGVEFEVACYAVKFLEVLIPDPAPDASFTPPEVGTNPEALQLATVLTPTIYFTTAFSSGQHNPLTYTVPVFLDANNTSWLIPRVRDSVAITGGVDEFIATAGGAIIDFIYVPSVLPVVLPSSAGFPPFFVLDQVALPAGSSRFPQTLIPGNCNAFRIREAFPGDDTLANIIQVLNT